MQTMHSSEVIIISVNEKVNLEYNNYLQTINDYIYKYEIKIAWLARYLGVKKRDTVYDYLNGTHIIPYDKVLLLNELMAQK